jgi:integrase
MFIRAHRPRCGPQRKLGHGAQLLPGLHRRGRLFRGARGGILSESAYGRTWHAARAVALGPELAATPLARRPYDLRHAALSLWLNATADPARFAARGGNSTRILHASNPSRGETARHVPAAQTTFSG